MRKSALERFDSKMEPEPMSGCFLWTGGTRTGYGWPDGKRYGLFKVNGKNVLAHRVAFELFRGQIPVGMCVLHSCDNPPCVNPQHLHLGTYSDNMREKIARGRHSEASKTHCKRGHEFNEKNTHVKRREDGSVIQRECRACRPFHEKTYLTKKRNLGSIRSAA